MTETNHINTPKPIPPSEEEIRESYRKEIANWRKSANAFSYWFPRLLPAQFKYPKTIYFPLSDDDVMWLASDKYEPEAIKAFGDRLITQAEALTTKDQEDVPDLNKELFIKTGNYSDKFNFRTCHLEDINDIGKNYLSIFYGGMLVGCPISPEVVIREFINTDYERDAIYSGMKLNTEFRAFYDFTAKRLLAVYPYWDRETMIRGLCQEDDIKTFDKNADALEEDFKHLSPILEKLLHTHLDSTEIDLSGIWSLDFLWSGKEFYFIDAAMGQDSAYFGKLIEDGLVVPK